MESIEHIISLLSPSATVKPCNWTADLNQQLVYEPALNVLTLTSSSAVDILIRNSRL